MFMERITKSLVLIAAAAAWTAWPAAAQSAPATNAPAAAKPALKAADLFPDSVVAKGKGVEVKRNQLDDEVIRVKSQIAARGQAIAPEQASLLEKQILQQLIQFQLIKGKANDSDRADAQKEAAKLWDDAKTQLGTEDALNLRLKAQGLTREELLAKWSDGELAKDVLIRDLKISITNEEIKKFYDDNPSQFEEPEMARASHILLSTRDMATNKELSDEQKAAKHKLAEDLLKRARAGEDFGKLAKEYSEDPGSKDKGGEYKFPRGQMVKEFETAAFSLNTNQVSDIVTTQFGYHIIKLSERYPARKHELSEVSPKIKDYLTQSAIQKQGPEYLDKLQKDASVEILDESLKPAPLDSAASPAIRPSAEPPKKPETK
ncbi:MAG TPA: peptidylprolyl isomerase [Candidatus Acidoferrum sp.]|jgi:peptidyl-prolyl cis-trans isomerase C|nr:peptidylprolyl isomerase [Candidatus Acidoferrum sp.]